MWAVILLLLDTFVSSSDVDCSAVLLAPEGTVIVENVNVRYDLWGLANSVQHHSPLPQRLDQVSGTLHCLC